MTQVPTAPVFQHGATHGTPSCRTFTVRSPLPVAAETAFSWHERPGAFQRLMPPWDSARLTSHTGGIRDGGRAEIELAFGPLRCRWIAMHQNYDPPRQFQDRQVSGPFAEFVHTHRIIPAADGASELEDAIEYRLPGGWLGNRLGGGLLRSKLERMFRYRHQRTQHDLAAGTCVRNQVCMKILITGATGLVGSELTALLTTQGHEVFRLVRGTPTAANDIPWNPEAGTIPTARLEGLDAVVHLAGENIAKSRWTAAVKQRMRSSRVDGTRLLCEALAGLQAPPKTLICASAIGYYGSRGAEIMTETSAPGTGYLAEMCRDWEAAAEPVRSLGMRVVHARIGVVLSPRGGALAKMLTPFKLGLGGIVGDGKQYWSWIAIDDVAGALHYILTHPEISGAVNVVAPNSCTNYDFTKTLGGVLHRPTLVPMPAFAARLALGEMADELLLSSTRVAPIRLREFGYPFRCPTLESALKHVLGK